MLDERVGRMAAENSRPAVSVVIPTFNRAEFIAEAIASVLRQSYPDFELIVVDDGSTDATADVVKTFDDDRLIFLSQENRGRSVARNLALAKARGRYIAFLDSDDLYLEDKLEKQIAYMDRRPDVGMVYTSAHCIDERGKPLEHSYAASVEGEIYKQVAFFLPVTITLPTVMVRREVLESVGNFDEVMERFEDTDLWRRIAKRYPVGAIMEPTCRLRTHADNALLSQNPHKIVNAIEYYVTKVFREDADVGIDFLQEGASLLYEYYGNAFIGTPGWRCDGIALLKKSAAYKPERARSIALAGLKTFVGSIARQYGLHRR